MIGKKVFKGKALIRRQILDIKAHYVHTPKDEGSAVRSLIKKLRSSISTEVSSELPLNESEEHLESPKETANSIGNSNEELSKPH